MASTKTTSTLWSLGILAAVLYLVWWWTHKSPAQASSLPGGLAGGGDDVLAPWNQQQPFQLPKLSFGSGGGGGSNQKQTPPPSGTYADGQNVDLINSIKEGFDPATGGLVGDIADANGNSLANYAGLASLADQTITSSDNTIASLPLATLDNLPTQDIPGYQGNYPDDPGSGLSPYAPGGDLSGFADGVNNLFSSLFGGGSSSDSSLSIPSAAGAPANGYSDTSGLSDFAESYDIASEVQDASGDSAGNSGDVASYGGSSYDEGGASDSPADAGSTDLGDVADNGGGGFDDGGDSGGDS